MFNRLQGRIKWPDVKLTPHQESNLTLAMSVLEWCRFWSNLTSELALYNASLESTRPWGSFDVSFAFRDGAKVPDSLRHGTSSMINYGVGGSAGHELVVDGAVSLCSVEGDNATQTDSFDFGSRSEVALTSGQGVRVDSFLWGIICELSWFFFLRNFANSFFFIFRYGQEERCQIDRL